MKIKKTNNVLFIGLVFFLFGIIYFGLKMFFFKREYFCSETEYWGSYFFKIEDKPIWYFPFKNVYKVNTNIYTDKPNSVLEKDGWELMVFMKDSVLYQIVGKCVFTNKEYPLIDLTTNGMGNLNFELFPRIEKIDSLNFYKLDFLLPSHSDSEFKGLVMKITYRKGIESVYVINQNNDIQ